MLTGCSLFQVGLCSGQGQVEERREDALLLTDPARCYLVLQWCMDWLVGETLKTVVLSRLSKGPGLPCTILCSILLIASQ